MNVLDMALAVTGMSEAQRADLEAQFPVVGRLVGAIQEAEPLLTQAKVHIDALIPIYAKLSPIIDKAWPDVIEITPSARGLVAFIEENYSPKTA